MAEEEKSDLEIRDQQNIQDLTFRSLVRAANRYSSTRSMEEKLNLNTAINVLTAALTLGNDVKARRLTNLANVIMRIPTI